ncbi:unnamed protein product [Closterium sp. Yama58-4]|nr:unnamed protein product [Closterium sp. Yama58-4]
MRSSSSRTNGGAAGMGFTSPRDADAAEARRLQRAALLQARGGPNSMEKRFLRFISAGTFLDSATLSSVAPILPGYARRFGLTQHAVTLLLAARNVTSVLASLPIGVLLLLISVPTIFAATFSLSTLASLSLAFPIAGAGSLAAALVLQGVATQSVRSVGLFFAARVCGSGASLDEVVDQLAQKGSEGLHKLLGSGRLWTARGRTSLSSAGAAGGGSASEGLFVVRSGDQVFRSAAADYSLTGTHFPTAFADGMDGTPSGSSSAASSAEASLLIGVIGSLLGWASLGTLIGPLFGSFAYQYLSPWIAYLGGNGQVTVNFEALGVEPPPEPSDLPDSFFSSFASRQDDTSAPTSAAVVSGAVEEAGAAGTEAEADAEWHEVPLSGDTTIPAAASALSHDPHSHDERLWGGAGQVTAPVAAPAEAQDAVPAGMSVGGAAAGAAAEPADMIEQAFNLAVQTLSFGALEATLPFFLADTCDAGPASVGLAFALNGLAYSFVAYVSAHAHATAHLHVQARLHAHARAALSSFSAFFTFLVALASSVLLYVRSLSPGATNSVGMTILAWTLPLLMIQELSCSAARVPLYLLMAANGVGYALTELPSFASLVSALESEEDEERNLLDSGYARSSSYGERTGGEKHIDVAVLVALYNGADGAGDHARPSTGQNVPQWYYQDWAGEHGPRTLLQLTQALQKGYFTPDLLVRKEGTQRWHTLRDVLDLRQLLRARKHGQAAPDASATASTGTPSRTAVSLEAATAASAAALAGISPRRDGSPAGATSAAASAAVPVVSLIPADDPITNLFKTPGQEWFYVDMHGEVQGPFSSQKMQRWWTNPLYKDHFSSLKCRRGHHGEFRLLPEIAEEVAARGPPPESPKQLGYRDPASAKKAPKSERYVRSGSRKEESDLAKEVEELKQQVERLEVDNEGLRNSQEDTFIVSPVGDFLDVSPRTACLHCKAVRRALASRPLSRLEVDSQEQQVERLEVDNEGLRNSQENTFIVSPTSVLLAVRLPRCKSTLLVHWPVVCKEVEELKQQVERLEVDNEGLRNSQEDTFIVSLLRMQVERLLQEKAELAREVTMLKREKESLQELLQYAQQLDIADEGVADELIADASPPPLLHPAPLIAPLSPTPPNPLFPSLPASLPPLQLRMQVERLLREKAELAREVTMLKREKESLQELLQYAQQFDIADEGVADELIAGEEGEGMGGNEWGAGEGDRATEEWFQMLEAASHKNPNGLEEN